MAEEKKVIATIRKVMPAVVSIAISKHLADLERGQAHELYSFLPGHHTAAKKKSMAPKFFADKNGMVDVGGGTGFIASKDGLILTNKHVISDPKAEYTVITNTGEKLHAKVISRDPINDVAILKVEAKNLPTVKLAGKTNLELGQSVIAIGNALGMFRNTVSLGIISGLSRSVTAKDSDTSATEELRGLIQTDAAINPGNSGGPLVNLDGAAIGINAAVVFEAQSIGFAIPIQSARHDLEDLKKYGRIRRPFLGVRYLLINDLLKTKMNVSVDYGALVVDESPHDPGVAPMSPAAKAGIRTGDIILELNGARVDAEHSIQDFLDKLDVHDTINLIVLRGNKRFSKEVILVERI